MTADLATFLAEVAARPLEWGRCDCCLAVADWIATRAGVDPAADLRGRYEDEAGAERAVAAEGGLVALFAGRLEPRMARVGAARPGDVAVVGVHGSDALFAAIATASGFAVKTTRGLVVSRAFRPVASWRLADG